MLTTTSGMKTAKSSNESIINQYNWWALRVSWVSTTGLPFAGRLTVVTTVSNC